MLHFNKIKPFKFLSFTITIVLILLTASCSKTPDVRLTLCQELTELLLNSPENLEWQDHKPIIRGYNDLEMQVSYSLVDSDATAANQASCFYTYIQDQDAVGAEEFNAPTSAYSTYPIKMILNGKSVGKNKLANLVNLAMVKQGKRAVVKVKETVEQGIETINEEVGSQLEK